MTEPSASATVLSTVRNFGPLSRAAVSRKAGLSASVVSTVVRDLLDRGVIRETGTTRTGMGRPSILLTVTPEHAYFLGFSLDGTGASGLLADLGGTVRVEVARGITDTAPERVLGEAERVRDHLLAASGVNPARLAGAGVALSGLVDTEAGMCIRSTVLGWTDVPIGPLLEERLALPVVASNDADAVAVGQRLSGAAQGESDFAVVSIGQGIGAGMVVGGRLHRGAYGAAGELGHCTVQPDGPACRCGKRGCLEAVASVPAVLTRAREQGVEAADLETLERLAAAGDPVADAELRRAGHAIGLAVSHLVNLFGPTLVILTGSGTRLGPVLQRAVLERHAQHVIPMLPAPPRLLFRHEDGSPWARGAANFATHAYLARGGAMAEPRS